MDEEIVAYCAECGNPIYAGEQRYVVPDGHVFCCAECVLEHYEVKEVE